MPSDLLHRAPFFTPSVLHDECPSPSILLHTQRPSSCRTSLPSFLFRRVSFFTLCLICRASYCTSSPIHQASFLLPDIVHSAKRVSISTVRHASSHGQGLPLFAGARHGVSFVYACIFNSLAWPIYLCFADRWLYIGSRYSVGSLECHPPPVGVRTNVISNKRAMLRFLITHNGIILYHFLVIPGGHPAWNRAKTLINDKLL
jgi:hypothetical protein